jgi:hypothetical protein
MTDFHFDPYYATGSDVSSLCHRMSSKKEKWEEDNMKKEKVGGVAGKFGTLGSECDSSTALVDAAFKFMKAKVPDADFAIYTGDSARHVIYLKVYLYMIVVCIYAFFK